MHTNWNFHSKNQKNVKKKTALFLKDVPEQVLKNKRKYNFRTISLPGSPIYTEDIHRAKSMPNFEDLTKIRHLPISGEFLYGDWGEPIDGIAPDILVQQKSALQIEPRMESFKGMHALQEGAKNIQVTFVPPEENPLMMLHTDEFERLPSSAKGVAKITSIPFNPTETEVEFETTTGYKSEGEVPSFAEKTGKTRQVSLTVPHEDVAFFTDVEAINEEFREYALLHPIPNKHRPQTEKPGEFALPLELEIGKKRVFIPFEIGKKEFFDFSKDSEELKANLTSSFSTDEIHEILKVAEKKIFFFPPEKSPETKEMRLGKSEDFLQKLIDSGYTQESAKMIQAAAEVVHMELVYGKPENKFNDFSGVAKDLVELREKLIELKTFDHQHIVKIIQNAQKISDSPSIFAWSRKEYYTYSWSEKTGYIWSGEYKTTFHWFPPLYQVGLEYEYAWKLKRTYSYSKIFDFDIEIPRYLVRQVEPKTRVEVTPLYSFSYDVEEYVWDEPENNDSSLEQLPKNR